jgi:putative ABC transport system permease protein
VEALWQDFRYAARNLGKSRGFTVMVLAILALGIGANSAIFGVVDAALLRPLPYHEPDRLVTIYESSPANDLGSRNSVAPGNYLDWREQNRVFEHIGAVSLPGFTLTGTDRSERVLGAAISAGMLHMLGLRPVLGREFEPADDRADSDRVVMLNYSLWQRRFGGDPRIVGKTIRLGVASHLVIGVLPAGLRFPREDVELWVPLEQTIAPNDMRWRDSHYLDVYARLKHGITLPEARGEMNRIAGSLKQAYPTSNSGAGALLIPLQTDLGGNVRPALLMLLAAVGFVLIIACANVGNLMLVRGLGCQKEMSVRMVLGASSLRILRQALIEGLFLSVAGGSIGLMFAGWMRQALLALRPAGLPRQNVIETDARVLLFTLGISVLAGILCSLAPALGAARSDLNLALRGNSRETTAGPGARRWRDVFVTGEIAISLVLLIGSGLLIRSFVRLQRSELGFRIDHTVTARISIPPETYSRDDQVASFCDRLLENIRALPGVEAAGMVSYLPLTGRNSSNGFDIEGRPPRQPSDRPYALIRIADPRYFKVLQIPVMVGRGIEDWDRADMARVVVISESMARRYWPGGNPIGEHLKVDIGMDQSPWKIVGVVRDVRASIAAEPEPTLYFPYAQMPYRYMVLAVRTHADEKAILETMRAAAGSLDADQPLYHLRTLDELMAQTLMPWRFSMTLLALFAALALMA